MIDRRSFLILSIDIYKITLGSTCDPIVLLNAEMQIHRLSYELEELDKEIEMADSPSNEKFYPGSQVAYIPTHANGNIDHQDVQFGFVTSDAGEKGVFVMYWNTESLTGKGQKADLRTKSNSELTPRDMVIRYATVPRSLVEWAWKKYRGGDLRDHQSG